MKYEIGDKIIVLYSNEEGEVVDIINEKMVMIDVRGVKFPAYLDQIDFPYFKRFSEKKLFPEQPKAARVYVDQITKEKKKKIEERVHDGLWLHLIPKFSMDEFDDEQVDLFKIHLVNRTNEGYRFIYRQGFFGEADFELKNEIPAFQDFYLHDLNFSDFNDHPFFSFELEQIKPDKNKAPFFSYDVKLKPKQIFKLVETMKQKNEPHIRFKIMERYPLKTVEEKGLDLSSLSKSGYKIFEASKAKNHLPSPRSVIDLHIEKLIDDYRGMNNFEILSLQLKEFEKWFELAVLHYLPTLTVIHGVGKGKLKDEIHAILKTRPEVKSFVNQYHPSFGYGATEIYFKY